MNQARSCTTKNGTTQLRLNCGSRAYFERVLEECAGRVLGVLAYGAVEPELPAKEFPCVWVQQPVFGVEAWYEIWVSTQPVTVKSHDQTICAQDGRLIFGCLMLTEVGNERLESKAFEVYTAIFDRLDCEDYPQLLRVWNYFPRINGIGSELERYREFNVGRHRAFSHKNRTIFGGSVPAACTLGTKNGGLAVCFLASRVPGVPLENPRQTSAYRYPKHFGPRSPIFSRGMLLGDALFISGTASIIGSETAHPGNIFRQLDETLENLQSVIRQAQEGGFDTSDSDNLFFNVYLRYAEDYPGVRARLDAELGGEDRVVYILADICRADLLIEVEAFWISK